MEKLKIERMNGMTEEELNKVTKVDIQLDIDKLNRIYDLEQELGIPLEVLFKALKDGIYWKTYQDKAEHSYMGLFEAQIGGFYLGDDEYNDVFTKEYGVTWALTREELE